MKSMTFKIHRGRQMTGSQERPRIASYMSIQVADSSRYPNSCVYGKPIEGSTSASPTDSVTSSAHNAIQRHTAHHPIRDSYVHQLEDGMNQLDTQEHCPLIRDVNPATYKRTAVPAHKIPSRRMHYWIAAFHLTKYRQGKCTTG